MSASAAASRPGDHRETPALRWNVGTRIAFRFCLIYFTLFCLATQGLGGLFPIPKIDVPELASLPPILPIVQWTAVHIFKITRPLVFTGSGSGDKTFDWLLVFCLLVFAAAGAGLWTALARKRENHEALYRWFRLFIRFALASELILYGMDKAVPLQMPFPFLTRLIEPYGNFSPMGNLWSFIGASRPYEIFVGCAEIFGGILLIVPRTALFGALVCLADVIQVFLLNMTYDVPVKLFSFHLLLMSLILLAPEMPRLWRFFFLNRTVEPSGQRPLFRSRRANRLALAAQVFLGLWILGVNAYSAQNSWYQYGGGRPKPPFYGIWNVTKISTGGASGAPYFDRWRRVVFDFPGAMSVQQMDDSVVNYGAIVNAAAGTLLLTGRGAPTSRGHFTFERAGRNEMNLTGDMDGQRLRIELQLLDRDQFLLVKRGFHWIQEYPLNR